MSPARVAIVGGGIAGLATALALRQRGLASTVYERAPALREVGAGIALWPNGTRVLGSLGVLNVVAATAGRADSVEILTATGTRLVRMDTSRAYAPSLCVRRPDLLAALADAVGNESIRLGHEVVGVDQHGGAVELAFANGTTAESDLVVAADGLRSLVRREAVLEASLGYRGYTVWRGIGPAQEGWPSADACEVWGRRQRFGLFRLSDGQAYWYVCASRPPGQRSGDERTEAASVVASWHPAIASIIAATPEVHRHDVWDRAVRGRTLKGRIVLVGDAAHGMTPDLEQGGAQALIDASQLAYALDTAGSLEKALATFARQQKRRTTPVVLQSRFAAWVGQLGGPSASVRDAITWATPSRMFGAAFTAAY